MTMSSAAYHRADLAIHAFTSPKPPPQSQHRAYPLRDRHVADTMQEVQERFQSGLTGRLQSIQGLSSTMP